MRQLDIMSLGHASKIISLFYFHRGIAWYDVYFMMAVLVDGLMGRLE